MMNAKKNILFFKLKISLHIPLTENFHKTLFQSIIIPYKKKILLILFIISF